MCSRERVAWSVVSVGRAYCIHLLPHPYVRSFHLSPRVRVNTLFLPVGRVFCGLGFAFPFQNYFFPGDKLFMMPMLVVFLFCFLFFFPPATGAWMVVLGVRIESV